MKENEPKYAPKFSDEHSLQVSQARDYYVVQHNDLVQKQRFVLGKNDGGSLTHDETRLWHFLLSRITPDAIQLEPIVFTVKYYCEVCGISQTSSYYSHLKKTIEKLLKRVRWLHDNETGCDINIKYIDRVIMHKGSGQIAIKLDSMLNDYLIGLKGNYFQYSLHNVLPMTSTYGPKLFELLTCYCFGCSRIEFELDDLRERLDATHYKDYYDFKKRVLLPALRDINTFTNLQVTIEKTNERKITKVVFEVKNLSNSELPENREEANRRYMNAEESFRNAEQFILDGFI